MVQSFYHEADQPTNQNKHFLGRTSLLKENIKKGNASLLLKNIVVGDEGGYRCIVTHDMEKTEFIFKLHVEDEPNISSQSPVTTIQIQKGGEQLICSPEGIFPEPQIRWSKEHALAQALSNISSIRQEMQTELYSINSTLNLTGDMDYICDISSLNSSRRMVDNWHCHLANSLGPHHQKFRTLESNSVTASPSSNIYHDVWCRWNTSCVLEAGFPIGDDVVIHWLHLSVPEVYVHSFYHEADQFAYQNKQFMGRTSLFKKKIKQGNASLLLKNVIVEDEGRYKCYVGTHTDATESFIQLHVEAPVTTIQIQKVDKQLICSSERIFPKPELRWSTKPALPHALNTKFQINQEWQTQLYDIKGSLDIADDSDSYVEYVCDIRSSRSSKRDTWKKPYVITT
ncbi:butyrophilin-like protein 2 [Corythoichthys intestinalis]|uniref:butyrophilin-like protein 2 n=1 Tax=Corythoichthys intestinalis TaxID=161448 RepID=UPI0025A64873|nr:butyrophilin-like protein 2 [Corythoichthys intestinalis]